MLTYTSQAKDVDRDSYQDKIGIQIPTGYKATYYHVTGHFEKKVSAGRSSVEFRLGQQNIEWKENHNDDWSDHTNLSPNLTPPAEIAVDAERMDEWNVTITVKCEPTEETNSAWAFAAYSKIIAAHRELEKAYQTAKADYDKAAAEHAEKWEAQLKARHPFYNRETAHTEIKRSAIYLMCQSFKDMDAMNWMSEPCGLPELDRPKAKKLGHEAYFWDRAFDWDLMSYILFDYFWNPMCKWVDNFDVNHPDAMFKAFLQAGYARVHIPVSEGMEEDVEWYLQTGQKWGQGGKPPLNAADPRWRSIAQELKLQRGCRQDDRPGTVDLTVTQTNQRLITIQGSDYYLKPDGTEDTTVIAYDINREIFIDFVQYRIIAIARVPGTNNWEVTLDRPYEGDLSATPFHAVGARFVGAPFLFEVPTDLVWASAHDSCLPCYPVDCKK